MVGLDSVYTTLSNVDMCAGAVNIEGLYVYCYNVIIYEEFFYAR